MRRCWLLLLFLVAVGGALAVAFVGGYLNGGTSSPQTGAVNASLTLASIEIHNGMNQGIQVTSMDVRVYHAVEGSLIAEVHAALPLSIPAGGNASLPITYVTLRPINEIEAQYGDLPQLLVQGSINYTTQAGTRSLPVQLTITMGDLVTMITSKQ